MNTVFTSVKGLLMLCLLMLLATAAGLCGAESATWQDSYHFPSGSMGPLAVHKGYAYVMNRWTRGDGLMVFDARKPESFRFLRGIAGNGYLSAWTRSGDTLYITTGFSLMVADISRPEECRIVRNLSFGFPAMDADVLAVSGNCLLMGGRSGGLRLFDIAEPLSPVLMAHYPEMRRVVRLAADESLVAVQTHGQDSVLASREGFALTERARLKTRGDLRLQDGLLFDTDTRGTTLYDVRKPASPVAVTNLPGVKPVGRFGADRLLVLDAIGALAMIDLSVPGKPLLKGGIALPANVKPGAMAVDGKRLYLLDTERFSLRLFDLSDTAAREVGERWLMRNEGTVELTGSHALHCYTQNQEMKVLSLPLREPGAVDFTSYVSLSLSNSLSVADVYRACAAKRIGHYLLAGDGLLDISRPEAPRVLKPATSAAADIAVEGGLAFLAQGDRLTILDISKLPEMKTVGVYRPGEGGHITDVAVGRGIACVVNAAKSGTSIEVIDIGDPAKPSRLGSCAVPRAIACALSGHLLYVPGMRTGGEPPPLTIIDVGKPAAPVVAASVTGLSASSCYQAKIHDGRLYYTDSLHGIRVADLADPLAPKCVGNFIGPTDINCSYTDFEIADGKLYGQRYSRLDVWRLEDRRDAERL